MITHLTQHISSKPSKQRKALYNTPSHQLRRIVTAHLSKDLRERYGRRSFPLRKGDSVKVIRGDFSGVEGKISEINRRSQKIYLEGITRENVGGQTKKLPIHPSNVILTSVNLDDKVRSQALDKHKKKKEKKKEKG